MSKYNDAKIVAAGGCSVVLVWILGILFSLGFWGGLVYFAFWCAKHFGVI